MENNGDNLITRLVGGLVSYMRRCLFRVLSVGPVPSHLAFILDGNRRYAKKWKLGEGMGHRAGFLALMTLMKYCYELGVKYVTIYAFSIDNFRRRPPEVQYVMDLMLEKIEGLLKEESIVNRYGVKVLFIGNLSLLHEPVRIAAEKAMRATMNNDKSILLICVAYTSTDEIVWAAQGCCEDNKLTAGIRSSSVDDRISKDVTIVRDNDGDGDGDVIKVVDIERRMYMGVAPDVDILVRTSGETRLSNFLLWQTTNGLLYSPRALWPEIGLRHIVWAVMMFQRNHSYMEKRKKQT